MKFYVVTPSFNQCDWLRCCVASVRDQVVPGHVQVHHHIQDACSTDGTPDWLRSVAHSEAGGDYHLSFVSEPDGGMYDAINRGWRAAPPDADIVAHLNCDEQYLTGALDRIREAFARQPAVDVLLADIIVVDENAEYVCHRRSLNPRPWMSRFCIQTSTACTFHRLSVTRDLRVFFDDSWRNLGDKVWYNALHQAGVRFGLVHVPVASFGLTGNNLNWTNEGLREKKRYEDEFQFGSAWPSATMARLNAVRRRIKEWGLHPPKEYALYMRDQLDRRRPFTISNPTARWGMKWPEPRPE